jgi:hypothetical protein
MPKDNINEAVEQRLELERLHELATRFEFGGEEYADIMDMPQLSNLFHNNATHGSDDSPLMDFRQFLHAVETYKEAIEDMYAGIAERKK